MNRSTPKVKGTTAKGSNAKATNAKRSKVGRGPRPYGGHQRSERAEATRNAVLDAALRHFVRDGYGATTIADIAGAAGVSVETVYKRFRNKAGLVRAIRERALVGGGDLPAEERSDALHLEHGDPRQIIEGWGHLTAEISPRVAPILLVVRDAAAVDPDLVQLRDDLDADRLRRMRDNAGRLAAGGHLRQGISESDAADVMFAASAPELYELLVLRQGWSPARYGSFVADALIAALLPLASGPTT